MRKSTFRLYLPFLALIAAQALLVTVLPSQGAKNGQQLAAGFNGSGGTNGQGGTGAGDQVAGASGTDAGTGVGGTGSVAGTSGSTGGRSGTGGTGGSGGGGSVSVVDKNGDVSHCKGNRQFLIVSQNNPPCVPKFVGDNGGATYQGVTKDKITIVYFDSAPNDQVNAILATQGLAIPYPEHKAFLDMATKFVMKHYELYGRKIDAHFYQGNCPTTPPDYDACNSEAKAVIQQFHPFLIVWGTPLYGSVFDIWANSKVPSFGGWQFDASLFNTRRPYRYDPWMNGTEIGAHLAEYYCKKMASGNADHSGSVIHATIGNRGAVKRKLGIVTPEIEANVLAAKGVIAAVKKCGGSVTDSPYTYESNIETATQQTQTTVTKLVQDKVTTVACMCDPIAPAFLTKGFTGNSYFPEFLLTGTQFLDADLVGRLYDQQQMKHAFGISSIPAPVSLSKADPTLVWRDMGSPPDAAANASATNPCEKNGCGIEWSYVNLLGHALQMAGPNLNPLTLEKGLLTEQSDGGWDAVHRPEVGFWKFGSGDYTWLSDTREVYWSAGTTSPVDNSAGAYVGVNGGRRYAIGQWTGGLGEIPVEPS